MSRRPMRDDTPIIRPDLSAVLTHYGIDHHPKHGNQQILCPVHDETQASCSLHLDKGLLQCFSCGWAGDVFTLIMEKERCSFAEALERGAAFSPGGGNGQVREERGSRKRLAPGAGYRPRMRREVPSRRGGRPAEWG